MRIWSLVILLAVSGASTAAEDAPPPPPDAIMAIPDDLRAALDEAVLARAALPEGRLALLMRFVFGPDGLGMQYDHAATSTVEEAYRSRRANCVTFTLLTVALAREAGLDAHAERIDEVLAWRQENDHIVRSDHVNTRVRVQQRRYTIDVAARDIVTRTPPRPIDDDALRAIYYGNRAMELMIAGRPDAAGPYMTQALALDPDAPGALSNSGVIANRAGDSDAAERAYLAALARDADHPGALVNLAQLYARRGDALRARALEQRSHRALARDPFHHFVAGFEAERAGDPAAAARRYARAIRLHPDEPRFHEALARTALQAGDVRRAIRALTRARALADREGSARYQAKLDLLQAHTPARTPRGH